MAKIKERCPLLTFFLQKLRKSNRTQKEEEDIPVLAPEFVPEFVPEKTLEQECVQGKSIETDTESFVLELRRFLTTKLPGDVLFLIASHLRPASRMCLALTCKSFLKIIDGSKCLRKSFKLLNQTNEMFQKHRLPYLTPRWELMILLETKKWRSCSDCFCLHPASEFPPGRLCESIGNVLENRRDQRCTMGPSRGYLTLCPCRNFTTRDLLRVSRKLSQPGVFQCQHSCLYKYNWDTVSATVTATPQDESHLLIETVYYMPEVNLPYSLRHVPRYCCRHRSIYQHLTDLRDIIQSPKLFPLAEDYKRFMVCNQCRTAVVDVDWDGDESTCAFKTRMSLEMGKFKNDGGYITSSYWDKHSFSSGDSPEYSSHGRSRDDDRNPWASWVPVADGPACETGTVISSTPALGH